MALQNSQYDALMRYYQRLQFRNKHEQDAHIAEAQAKIPRLAEIDREIASISVKKARILLGDKDNEDFDLNRQLQALSRERADLLKTPGYPEDYYPEDMINKASGQTARQFAETALERAKDFVQNFDHSFENLFIYGDTGVGKTFLTYCIAKELLDSMHSVIYYSAFDLFDAFARNTFSNSETTEC